MSKRTGVIGVLYLLVLIVFAIVIDSLNWCFWLLLIPGIIGIAVFAWYFVADNVELP